MPIYSGEHSITFGEKNTWDDWHLIPSSRPVFSPPQPNIRLLNIPGKSGSLDVTEVFGPVVYADRTGSFEFYVDHETIFEKGDHKGERWESWAKCYQEIVSYLHGQKLRAIMSDDPRYYYEGRFSVNEWRSNANFSTIVINYTVQPYKMMLAEWGNDWLWDEMDFYDSQTPLSSTMDIYLPFYQDEGALIELEGTGYRTIPVIECTYPGVQMYFDGQGPVELSAGSNKPSIAVITKGKHYIRLIGEGSASIHYRAGAI